MGRFYYGTGFEVDFDDRLLAHLQIVIGSKLAKNESFYFSWKDTQAVGDGRTTIWVHPAITLRFKYFGGRAPAINALWVRHMLADSHTPYGLRVSEEPPEPPHNGTAVEE